MMKFKLLFLLCTAASSALLAAPASAESVAPFKMDGAALGRLDAFLTVCAKADEKHRESYERYRTESIVFGEGTEHEMRVEGSDTPQYKEAYASMIDAAGKAPREDLAESCRRMIGVEVDRHN